MTNSDNRYVLTYYLRGSALDVKGLLARATPTRPYQVWSTGDLRGTRPATHNGLTIDLGDFPHQRNAEEALARFLVAENVFLTQAMDHLVAGTDSVVSCGIGVYPKSPTTIYIKPELLHQLGAFGIAWEVASYPFSEDDK